MSPHPPLFTPPLLLLPGGAKTGEPTDAAGDTPAFACSVLRSSADGLGFVAVLVVFSHAAALDAR